MRNKRDTARAVKISGFLISSVLASLVLVSAVTASPQVAPTNVEPPTITGTARVGEVLTAQNGTWTNTPTEFRYRWLRCNANGNLCVLTASDGKTYRLAQVDVAARCEFESRLSMPTSLRTSLGANRGSRVERGSAEQHGAADDHG